LGPSVKYTKDNPKPSACGPPSIQAILWDHGVMDNLHDLKVNVLPDPEDPMKRLRFIVL